MLTRGITLECSYASSHVIHTYDSQNFTVTCDSYVYRDLIAGNLISGMFDHIIDLFFRCLKTISLFHTFIYDNESLANEQLKLKSIHLCIFALTAMWF